MKIVFNDPQTGQAVVIYPSYRLMAERKISIDELAVQVVPEGATFVKALSRDLPKNDEFRGAWRLRDGKVDHDIDACRSIKKDLLRAERSPQLAAEDVKFMRALEAGEATAPIVSEKQRLRDVTSLVDQANTLDEIRAIKINDEMKG